MRRFLHAHSNNRLFLLIYMTHSGAMCDVGKSPLRSKAYGRSRETAEKSPMRRSKLT